MININLSDKVIFTHESSIELVYDKVHKSYWLTTKWGTVKVTSDEYLAVLKNLEPEWAEKVALELSKTGVSHVVDDE